MFIDYASCNYLQMNILLCKIIKKKLLKNIFECVWFFIILMPKIKLGKEYLQRKIKLWQKHKIKKLNHILVDFFIKST